MEQYKYLLGNIASILGMFGAMIFFVLLAVLIYKLIMYKESANKRSEFMNGIVNLIVGLIIIGLMVTIVEMIYYYIQQLQPDFTASAVQASNASMKGIFDKIQLSSQGGSLLAGLIGDLINLLVKGIYATFGISSINQLLLPSNATIFTAQQWTMIMGGYIILIIPAIVLMLFMVFKTGVNFMLGSIDPRKAVEARSDLLRWVMVLLLIVTGPIIIKGIVEIGSAFTVYLNSSIQTLMPNFDFQTSILTGAHLSNGLLGAIIQMYLLYLTIRFNILFIIRDMILIAFTIFTPIAITFWGIDSNVVSLKVWFGEIVTNALLAFCLSIGFLTFSLIFEIFNMNNAGSGKLLLVVLVGLTMILKICSTLRNSTQGFLFKFEAINEEKASKQFAGAGFIAAGEKALYRSGAFGATRILGNTGKKGAEAIKNKLEDARFNSNAKENSKMDSSAEKAGQVSDAINTDAKQRGIKLNPQDLTMKGKNGSTKKLANEAINSNFLDSLNGKMKSGEYDNRRDAAKAAKDKTVSDIANQYANDEELRKSMPEGLTAEQQKDWFDKKAENKFAEAVSGDGQPVNYSYEKDGKEYFDPKQAGKDKDLQQQIELGQQAHMGESNMARANMNTAYQDIAKGRVNKVREKAQGSMADFARQDRYSDVTARKANVDTNAGAVPTGSNSNFESSGNSSAGGSNFENPSENSSVRGSNFESAEISNTGDSNFESSVDSNSGNSNFGSSSESSSTGNSNFESSGSSTIAGSNFNSSGSSNFKPSESSSTGNSNLKSAGNSSTGGSNFNSSKSTSSRTSINRSNNNTQSSVNSNANRNSSPKNSGRSHNSNSNKINSSTKSKTSIDRESVNIDSDRYKNEENHKL